MPRTYKPQPTYAELIRRASEGIPRPIWTPLKPKPLPGYVQERIDVYRKIKSLMP